MRPRTASLSLPCLITTRYRKWELHRFASQQIIFTAYFRESLRGGCFSRKKEPGGDTRLRKFLNLRNIYHASEGSSQGEKFAAWPKGGDYGQDFLYNYINRLKMLIFGVFGKRKELN